MGNYRNMIRNQMESEQHKVAEMVCMELNELGFKCEIKIDGTQKRMGFKMSKLKIVPTEVLSPARQKEFTIKKNKLGDEYQEMRRPAARAEILELVGLKKESKHEGM